MKGILAKLRKAGEPNVIAWLKSMPPQEAWEALQQPKPQMNGIGHKLASFVLREVATFCDGWKDQIRNNGGFLQPVDRWVLRCCQSVWPQEQWPSQPPSSEKAYLKLAERIVNHCKDEIEAMNFNMGAWFVGANFQEIMAVHGVFYCGERLLDKDRLRLTSLFDPNKITRALCYEVNEVTARLTQP